MSRVTTRQAKDKIETLSPFTTNGALSGDFVGDDYVVKSYATAIAVITGSGEAYENTARYSKTTTYHQHAARMGMRGLDVTQISDPAEFTTVTGHHARLRTI